MMHALSRLLGPRLRLDISSPLITRFYASQIHELKWKHFFQEFCWRLDMCNVFNVARALFGLTRK